MVAIIFARSKDGKDTKLYDIFIILTIACTESDTKDTWGLWVADSADQKIVILASVEVRL